MSEPKDNQITVQIFNRINRLKTKAGGTRDSKSGSIDPKSIAKAQEIIERKASIYTEEANNALTDLTEHWKFLKSLESPEKSEIVKFLSLVNQVKDLAATFGFPLMQHFALSLKDFSEKMDLGKEEHKIIIQAHTDTMWAVYSAGIKDHGDKNAEELKLVVLKAIEKYG